ncbi:MAG: macrolide family glycosyltransferase [Candidatus Ventricola sp.]
MSSIWFCSIPAHGHVNPTLPVVRELVRRGHSVRYYEVEPFRARIEAAGASFVDVTPYMPPAPENIDRIAGRDFAALIEMVVDTTLALDERFAQDVARERPDAIVSDSVCFWGKLLARKHGIPFVCSTTTMAFNAQSARYMKRGVGELLRMLLGMPRINRKMALLREHGYDVPDFLSVIQNDSETDTVVYTSRCFQPMAETFGERYAFVGPTAERVTPQPGAGRPRVYVSLGTVLHDNPRFYHACVEALAGLEAVLSVGEQVDIASLGALPEGIRVYPRVDQMQTLAQSDVFITHCGMNSVQESLLCGVPMVLFPQHSEENAVAARVQELGAGMPLKHPTARAIREAVDAVLGDASYRAAAHRMREDFLACGGAAEAADFILRMAGSRPADA